MNWNNFKILIKLICVCLGFYGVERFCHRQTDGFAVSKISHILKDDEDLLLNPSLLEQKFYYFAKGAQCYVFLGEDNQTILKLFRSSRYQLNHFLHSLFSFIPDKNDPMLQKTMESYSWATIHFSEESALLGTHLGKSFLNRKLQIVDKIGIVHTIDLQNTPFVLQSKATLVKDKIAQLVQTNKFQEAKTAMKNLFFLIKKLEILGMSDTDANLSKNFGFIHDRPVFIDVGSLQKYSLNNKTKLFASKENMQHWLNATYPEFAKEFDETFREYMESHEAF